MRIVVRFFASTREEAGTSATILELPEQATGKELWDVLVKEFPSLAPYRNQCRLAVNDTYVPNSTQLQEGDTVCLIPPVSGG